MEVLLGQGGFSKVWRCRHRTTGQVRALKKIDTTELNPRAIATEIALMKLLKHENVVRCHEVFLEAQFVSIVIDIFAGGDLIDGLNKHKRLRNHIEDAQLAQIVRQMVAAIVHVHSLRIVHRDIKGENFLLDRPDLGDPDCCIALADFGTATRMEQGGKLHQRVGTPAFWAPEIYKDSYDFLVDVWAIGVTTFILLAGALPFEGEAQICEPQVEGTPVAPMPRFTPQPCADFVTACLTKELAKRPPATDIAQHPWLQTARPTAAAAADPRLVALDILGAVAAGCFSGLSLCLDIIIGGSEGQQKALPAASGSEGQQKDESPSSSSVAYAAVDTAGDPADIEKEVTKLAQDLEKVCSKKAEIRQIDSTLVTIPSRNLPSPTRMGF